MVIKPQKKVVIEQPRQFAGDVLPSVGVMSAKAESMLMGFVVPMDAKTEEFNRTEVIWYVSYIMSVLNGDTPADHLITARDVWMDINKYSKNIVKHITTNKLMGMNVITFTLDNEEEEFPKRLDTPEGVFSYVYNITCPECSELGYTFYEEKVNNMYHRVG